MVVVEHSITNMIDISIDIHASTTAGTNMSDDINTDSNYQIRTSTNMSSSITMKSTVDFTLIFISTCILLLRFGAAHVSMHIASLLDARVCVAPVLTRSWVGVERKRRGFCCETKVRRQRRQCSGPVEELHVLHGGVPTLRRRVVH